MFPAVGNFLSGLKPMFTFVRIKCVFTGCLTSPFGPFKGKESSLSSSGRVGVVYSALNLEVDGLDFAPLSNLANQNPGTKQSLLVVFLSWQGNVIQCLWNWETVALCPRHVITCKLPSFSGLLSTRRPFYFFYFFLFCFIFAALKPAASFRLSQHMSRLTKTPFDSAEQRRVVRACEQASACLRDLFVWLTDTPSAAE